MLTFGFYLNVVGYKGILDIQRQEPDRVFYLNVVGYKVTNCCLIRNKKLVLSERSGI